MPASRSDSCEPVSPKPLDRLLDVYRWIDHPEMKRVVDHLVREIEASEQRSRRRSVKAAKQFRDAVRVLATDLILAAREVPSPLLGVSRRNGAFNVGGRYAAWWLSTDTFRDAFGALECLGYLEVVRPGFHDARTGVGRTSRIRGTVRLLALHDPTTEYWPWEWRRHPDADPIVRKGIRPSKGRPRPIPHEDADRERVELLRAPVRRLNAILERHWVDIDLTNEQHRQLADRMLRSADEEDDERKPLHLDKRTLYRVFNDGSLDRGGRFYGAWWQSVPKEYRRHITIDGKPTVEVDYSGMHPAMLYARVEQRPPNDPYSPVDVGLHPGTDAQRQLVKQTFNSMLNARTRHIARPDGFDELVGNTPGRPVMTFKELKLRIEKNHSPIKQWFQTGVGLDLQYQDSCIAERVMLDLAERGIPVLPVHDSFIVHSGYEADLRKAMKARFIEVVGEAPGLKADGSWLHGADMDTNASSRYDEDLHVTDDIDEILDQSAENGWDLRMDAWRRREGYCYPQGRYA